MKFTLTGDEIFGAFNQLTTDVAGRDVLGPLGLKFARITKAVRVAAVEIQEQREKIRQHYATRFPSDHPTHAGQIVPVYKDGTKEADRRPDNSAAIVEGAMTFTDEAGLRRDLTALGVALSEIDCPTLTSEEIAGLTLKPVTVESLLWNIDAELPVDAKPERRRRALRSS